MITHSYKIYKKTCLIVSENPYGFEIQTGDLTDPQAFSKNQTYIISGENPNLLWDIIHNLVGIPFPQLNSAVKSTAVPIDRPVKELSLMEQEFNKMSAKEIVEKIALEKGISLTFSLKSKRAIIRKALEIYS